VPKLDKVVTGGLKRPSWFLGFHDIYNYEDKTNQKTNEYAFNQAFVAKN